MLQQWIILDRDGVINYDSDNYIKSVDEFIPLPGSMAAMARLYQENYAIAIATNQSGIARHYFTLDTLQQMHHKLAQLLAEKDTHVADIVFCPHAPYDHCSCRKPLPGLLQQLQQRHHFQFADTWVIGDSWRDLQAALAVNAKPVLVKTGKGERTLRHHAQQLAQYHIPIYADLYAFVDHLLS